MTRDIEKIRAIQELEHLQTAKPGRVFSPKDLEDVKEDPTKLQVVARLMGAVNLENLFVALQDRQANASLKLDFQKLLNKMGGLEPDTQNTGGGGPQVVINITRAKDNSDSVTIDGTAIAVD